MESRKSLPGRPRRLKWSSVTFLTMLMICCAIVTTIVIYTLVTGDGKRCTIDGEASTCPVKYVVNKSITSFALLVFQLWFGFSGVLGGNQYEFLSAYGIGFLLCAFAASRLFGNLPTIMLYDVIMFVGVVFCQFACSVILPWLLKEHKWRLYRKVGADIPLRAMYTRYLVMICLVKVLLLLSIINGTSSGVGIQDKSGTIALDVLHWVSTLALAILGVLSFRFEWRAGVFITLLLGLYAPGYIIYWFFEIIKTKQIDSNVYVLRALAISFLTSGSLTLLIQPIALLLLGLQFPKFDTGFTNIFHDPYAPLPNQSSPHANYTEPVSLFGAAVVEEEDDLSDLDYGSRNSMGFSRDSAGPGLYGSYLEDDPDAHLYQ